MRLVTFVAIVALGLSGSTTWAAGIADEFGAGFGGVLWGTPLNELMQRYPGGLQTFSTASGGRSYTLNMEDSLFGIRRPGLRVAYRIGIDNLVDGIDIEVPYDQLQPLLKAITAKFGPYIGPEAHGISYLYRWPTDRGVFLSVRATRDSVNGFLFVGILKPAAAHPVSPKRLTRSGNPGPF